MPKNKPKVKVKEIKKSIKVTEIQPEKQESLEKKVDLDEAQQMSFSSESSAPVIRQDSIPQFTQETKMQMRQGIQEKDKEFSYASLASAPARTYDPSIRETITPVSFLESKSSGQRINPSIRQQQIQNSSQVSRRLQDVDQGDIDPSFRQSNEKEYRVERVEDYIPKRKVNR